jgi:MFS family permease
MRRPQGALWHHPDFLKMWTGQTISEVGSQVSQLAIPWLAAVELHASYIQFSLLGVFAFLPFILFALPAGVWVDRWKRREVLIAGDTARAVLLALIPILWFAGVLQIWMLLVLSFVIGIFTVFFDVAYQSYLLTLVGSENLIEGNSKLQLTVSVAQVGGPSLSGGLIAAITAPYAIVVDAVSFAISAVFLVDMKHRETLPEHAEGEERPKMWPQVKEGVRYVVGHRWLRYIAAFTATSNFMTSLLFAVFLLYATRTLGLSSLQVGFVFAVGSLGSIVGALTAGRLQARVGVGPAIVGTAIFGSLGAIFYPLAPASFPLPFLMLGQVIFGFGAVAYNITQVSLRQAITPESFLGRMNATMRFLVWGTIPIGSLIGAGLSEVIGVHATIWLSAVLGLFGFLPVLFSKVRAIVTMPIGDPEEPAAAPA